MSAIITRVFTLLVAIVQRLGQQGIEAATSTTRKLATLIREDYARYGKLIKDAGIKAD